MKELIGRETARILRPAFFLIVSLALGLGFSWLGQLRPSISALVLLPVLLAALGGLWVGIVVSLCGSVASFIIGRNVLEALVLFLVGLVQALVVERLRRDRLTARGAAEEADLHLRSLQDLRAAFDEHAIIAITDQRGRIVLANDRFCQISKFPREELLGQDHRIINSGHHPKEFMTNLWGTISAGKVWHGEIRNKAKDGSFYWVNTTIVPIQGEKGEARRFVAIRDDITRRKEYEESLARLAAIVNSAEDAIVGLDLKGVITNWNKGAERLFGYTAAEIVGSRFVQLMPEERLEEENRIFAEIGFGGRVEAYDTQRRTKEGRLVDVSVMASPILGANGLVAGVSKTFRDISVRKASDVALRESESRSRQISESLPQLIWTCDAQGQCDFVNQRWADLVDRAPHEVIRDGWLIHIHPDDLIGFSEKWGQCVNEGSPFQYELRLRRRDGCYRWFDARCYPLRNASNRIVKWFGSSTDITDRKEAEVKLQAQLGRMALLNRISRGISESHDLNGLYDVVLGSLEENLGVDFAVICLCEPNCERPTIASLGRRTSHVARKLELHGEFQIGQEAAAKCSKGNLIYEPDINLSSSPFLALLATAGFRSLIISPLAKEREVLGFIVCSRKDAYAFSSGDCEFLLQLSDHVSVAFQQSQLNLALRRAYDDLRQTQETTMAYERLRAMAQLASGVAHDINNAISPIGLYAELLLQDEPGLTAEGRSHLEIIARSIGDVAKTVSRMRELNRQREEEMVLTEVDLNSVVKNVIESTRARWQDIPQKSGVLIHQRVDLMADCPTIMGAPNEIRDAVINLIFNAVDAMPQGGVLTVRTCWETNTPAAATATRYVCIEVEDTGQGMDEETKARCLEPYFTTKGARGTGLGLAMVYGMTKRHSAELQLQSSVGKGTLFRLGFAVASEVIGPSGGSGTSAHPAVKVKILVIDDDPVLLKTIGSVLQKDGHHVLMANGGQEGIELFKACARESVLVDLVITDLGMPMVDGSKVASTIKGVSEKTPVIMLTGWGQRITDEGSIPPHVDMLLAKPPRLQELRSAISALTGPAKMADRQSASSSLQT